MHINSKGKVLVIYNVTGSSISLQQWDRTRMKLISYVYGWHLSLNFSTSLIDQHKFTLKYINSFPLCTGLLVLMIYFIAFMNSVLILLFISSYIIYLYLHPLFSYLLILYLYHQSLNSIPANQRAAEVNFFNRWCMTDCRMMEYM